MLNYSENPYLAKLINNPIYTSMAASLTSLGAILIPTMT